MAKSGELEADPVFLGLTRPPMLFGVSYMFVMLNFLSSVMYFIATSDFRGLFIALPLFHGIGYWMSSKEPLFIELFLIRQSKCRRCSNRLYYQSANSYNIL
jgi:type IV secretion system protein VirB3